MRRYIFPLLLLLVIGCESKNQNNNSNIKNTTKLQGTDTIPAIAISEWSKNIDTLKIVSPDNYLFFPFGKSNKIDSLRAHLSMMNLSTEFCYAYNDSTADRLKIFRFASNESYIKFLFNEDEKCFDIIYANIISDKILTSSKVHVGMTMKEFISITGKRINYNETRGISVVEIISEKLGIWHYYKFRNSTLQAIIIDSDYDLNKK
jgi:hypothetical protein